MTFMPAELAPSTEPPSRRRKGAFPQAVPARVLRSSGASAPTLVCLHGISRDARAIWSAFAPPARRLGSGLVVPHFSGTDWPHFQKIDASRPDLALLSALDGAETERGLATGRISLFGYSGGAQLAHRFAMLYPHRIATLHVAAPGWYCLPDESAPWPEGLGRAEDGTDNRIAVLKRRQVRTFLSLPVRLYVGGEDRLRDPALRRSPTLDARQGRTRLERAGAYLGAFRAAAARHGVTPDISLTVLPGCRHDFTDCVRTGRLAEQVLADLFQTLSRKG